MTSLSDFNLPRARLLLWLLAIALLSAVTSQAGGPPLSKTFSRPQVPEPSPVNPKDLPSAFTIAEPSSLADLRAIQEHVTALVARVSPSVVEVEVGDATGSGVVISEDGIVLTAGHVCERAGRRVKFVFPDGKTAHGITLGVNDQADTGLMRITDPGPWPRASVGEMNHARIGDWTLALGNPGGFDAKRSLVARLGRIVRLMPGVVQTDCTIFPGDSGGPLFDMYGRVIAIHTAIANSTAENFHVPITQFFETWDELASASKTQPEQPKAYCGVVVVDDDTGCRLDKIEKNSPAARADLKAGDHVLKVDGRRVAVAATFAHWIAESGPGETLNLEIKRGDKVFSVPITLQNRPRDVK